MKIYNEHKTQILNEQDIDYSLGYLKADKIVIAHHEATPFIKGKTVEEIISEYENNGTPFELIDDKYYRITATYPNGGKDTEEITDIADVPAKEAYDDYKAIQVYVPYTEEELKQIADNKKHAELKAELEKIKEDIEQETFGLVRNDFEAKKARAAEIINELRVLEGKEPREIKGKIL